MAGHAGYEPHRSSRPSKPAAATTKRPCRATAWAAALPVGDVDADAAAAAEAGGVLVMLAPVPLAALPALGRALVPPLVGAGAGAGVGFALAPSLSPPAVTVTGTLPSSEPSYVAVLLPGSLASLPLALSMHTALLDANTQSCVMVKAPSPGYDMSILYVEGP